MRSTDDLLRSYDNFDGFLIKIKRASLDCLQVCNFTIIQIDYLHGTILEQKRAIELDLIANEIHLESYLAKHNFRFQMFCRELSNILKNEGFEIPENLRYLVDYLLQLID
jgi:hypothetical protein